MFFFFFYKGKTKKRQKTKHKQNKLQPIPCGSRSKERRQDKTGDGLESQSNGRDPQKLLSLKKKKNSKHMSDTRVLLEVTRGVPNCELLHY